MCCVMGDAVFSASREFASIFAEKHDKDLIHIEGQISGWLAKDKPPSN